MKKPAKSTHHAAVNTPTNSNRNTAPVVIDTPQKQQTAKEAIAANVQLLIEQLEHTLGKDSCFIVTLQPGLFGGAFLRAGAF